MVSIVSFLCVVIFSFLLSSVFKGQSKVSHLASCLAMLVAMTKSTLVGILVATWFPNIVFSTIIAILFSLFLVSMMTYQLSIKIVIECISAVFMGAMMGAMLKIMTSTDELICVLFFSLTYILSVVVAAGFWRQEKYVSFMKGIPLKLILTSVIAIALLAVTTIYDTAPSLSNELDSNPDIEHKHHH